MTTLPLISRTQDSFETAFRNQIEHFQKSNPDIKVECTYLPVHDLFEEMVLGEGCNTGDFDLFLSVTDWLPTLIDQQKILNLDAKINQNPPAGFPDAWHPAMLSHKSKYGELFGLPWHDGPEVLHYRADLFEDPSNKEKFREIYKYELGPPKTWNQFIEVATFFTRAEEGLWGCVEAAFADGHNNVYDFLIQLWSRGGDIFDAKGNPIFDSPIGIEALQFYYDLFYKYKVAPIECLNLGSVECGDLYAQGNAAMSWNWCGFAAIANIPGKSKIIGKNRCAPIPGGVSLNIYWVLTIPSGSTKKEAAYRFLQHVSQPKTDKMTSLAGAHGVRLSTWRDPEILALQPQYQILEEVHKTTRTLPFIPEYIGVHEILNEAIDLALHNEMTVPEALHWAAKGARKLLKTKEL